MTRLITLTTDFGNTDGYPGVVKGVILSIAPCATIVDISHDVPSYDIHHAAWLLLCSRPYFPRDAIHVAVVDPQVGSGQKRLLVLTEQGIFILPDNGLISLVLKESEPFRAFVLDKPQYHLESVSSTFHARDIFAPVAAYLANGAAPDEVGTELAPDAVSHGEERLSLPDPSGADVKAGRVVHIDKFGNVITNIGGSLGEGKFEVLVDGKTVGMVYPDYQSIPYGMTGAVPASHGFIEIARYKEPASAVIAFNKGSNVIVRRKISKD